MWNPLNQNMARRGKTIQLVRDAPQIVMRDRAQDPVYANTIALSFRAGVNRAPYVNFVTLIRQT